MVVIFTQIAQSVIEVAKGKYRILMRLFIKKKYEEKTDEELMSLLTKGEQLAFDELYKRYSKAILNFFFRMINYNREKAEDMLHDLFLKIIEKPYLFDKTKKFSTWIYVVASNMLKNEYRTLNTQNEYINHQFTTQTDKIYVAERIDNEIFSKQLNNELNKLDIELKSMFTMRYMEEMSIKQIAEIFECPEGTVKSRLFYITKNLSVKLAIYKPEEFL